MKNRIYGWNIKVGHSFQNQLGEAESPHFGQPLTGQVAQWPNACTGLPTTSKARSPIREDLKWQYI